MKKIALTLAFLMVLSLAACGTSTGSTPGDGSSAAAAMADNLAAGDDGEAASTIDWAGAGTINMDEYLLNDGGVSVRAMGFSRGVNDDEGGYVRLYIKNNTAGEIRVAATDATIDGAAVDLAFDHTVAPTAELDCDLFFVAEDLAAQGVEHVGRVEVTFAVQDAASGDPLATSSALQLDFDA